MGLMVVGLRTIELHVGWQIGMADGQSDGIFFYKISMGSVGNLEGRVDSSKQKRLPHLDISGLKSSWASLFGSSSGNSLLYTHATFVGDKIVVTPSEEVIAQGV